MISLYDNHHSANLLTTSLQIKSNQALTLKTQNTAICARQLLYVDLWKERRRQSYRTNGGGGSGFRVSTTAATDLDLGFRQWQLLGCDGRGGAMTELRALVGGAIGDGGPWLKREGESLQRGGRRS
ncbi:hypothetical protein Hanom_Chr06g00570931 [Helianthus anomalus]